MNVRLYEILNAEKPDKIVKDGVRTTSYYSFESVEKMVAIALATSGGTKTSESIVDILQPQLNENQKALVIWMQENECYNGDPLESISDLFLEGTPSEHFPDLPLSCVEAAYQSLNNQLKIEMVQKYLEQYLEQEEE